MVYDKNDLLDVIFFGDNVYDDVINYKPDYYSIESNTCNFLRDDKKFVFFTKFVNFYLVYERLCGKSVDY